MLNNKVHFGRRAPFGSAILGLLGGHSRMVRREPCSSTPQNRMPILRQPIPLGGLGLRRFCETRGREKSVCNYEFTHVTHVVKLFMRVKYNRLHVIHILYITNKTYFRIRALFRILVLLQVDPTSFGGGWWEQGRFAKFRIFAVIRVNAKRGYFM